VPEFSIQVDEKTAEAIIEDIGSTVSSGAEKWELHGDLEIPEALRLRNDLQDQLD